MDPEVHDLLVRQHGVVAVWQLIGLGMSPKAVRHMTAPLRRVQSGVYVTGHAPLTVEQRHWAAVATAPGTVLSHISAAVADGFAYYRSSIVTVTRPGSGHRQLVGDVLVSYAILDPADIANISGVPATAVHRTLADLAGHISETRLRRCVREALRVGAATDLDLARACAAVWNRRGAGRLRAAVADYALPQAVRARSDAEVLALALLKQARLPEPQLNRRIAGFECDLRWPATRTIVELDGRSFHNETDDALRDAAWISAGWHVHRVSTQLVYDSPEAFTSRVAALLHADRSFSAHPGADNDRSGDS